MSCKYKDQCPSYSGWCEGPKQDFSRCVEFLVTAYEHDKMLSDDKLEKAIKAVSAMDVKSGVSQSVYVIEECSELIKELTKQQRGRSSEKDILAKAMSSTRLRWLKSWAMCPGIWRSRLMPSATTWRIFSR